MQQTQSEIEFSLFLKRFIRSQESELSDKLYFPEYPDNELWPLAPDYEAAENLLQHDVLTGVDSLSLFECAVLIGYRTSGTPGAIILEAPLLFARAVADGDIDPRHPLSMIPFSRRPYTFAGLADPDEGRPNMQWKLYRDELQSFAVKHWGRAIFTDEELEPWQIPSSLSATSGNTDIKALPMADKSSCKRESESKTDRVRMMLGLSALALIKKTKGPMFGTVDKPKTTVIAKHLAEQQPLPASYGLGWQAIQKDLKAAFKLMAIEVDDSEPNTDATSSKE